MTILILFLAAFAGAIVALRFRFPAILGYIASGIIVGNLVPGLVDQRLLSDAAEIGIVLLLFTLGIEFSAERLRRSLGKIAPLTVFQIIAVTASVYLLARYGLKLPQLLCIYTAIAGSLSSTAVVVRLLSDKYELDDPHGQHAVSWLVTQDLAVIPIMVIVPILTVFYTSGGASQETASFLFISALLSFTGAVTLIVIVLLFGLIILPKILRRVAVFTGEKELFMLGIISILVTVSAVFSAAGMSAALGAFVAGLLISKTRENHMVYALIYPLRNVFSVLFFTSLGMALSLSSVAAFIGPVMALSFAVILIKGSVVYLLLRLARVHQKVAFLTAGSLTQMSEFGFVLARDGLTRGVLGDAEFLFLMSLTLTTLILTTPVIPRLASLYKLIRKFRKIRQGSELSDFGSAGDKDNGFSGHVVIVGYGRVGKYISRALLSSRIKQVVIDLSEEKLENPKQSDLTVVYGDPADEGILDAAGIKTAKVLILAIPEFQTQRSVIDYTRRVNPGIICYSRFHHQGEQVKLREAGADFTVQPEFEAALTFTARVLNLYRLTAAEIDGRIKRLKIEHGMEV